MRLTAEISGLSACTLYLVALLFSQLEEVQR